MAIAKLTVDLEARLAGFERDLKQAANASQKAAGDIGRAFGVIKAGIGGLVAGIGVGFAVDLARNIIDGVDALNDLKDATGSSIENLSALEDIADRTGTSFESMSSTLVKFNKVLGEAKEGSEVANILKQIGLSAAELRKLDPAEALRQTAVALETYGNNGNKARIVQEFFGKSIKEAAPFLKDLAESGKLNATVTTEQAQAAEDFNKAMFGLSKSSKDAARVLVTDLVPAVTAVLEAFSKQGLRSAIDTFGNVAFDWEGSQLRKGIRAMESELEDLQKRQALLGDSFAERFAKVGGGNALLTIGDDAEDLTKQINETTAALNKLRATYLKLSKGEAGGGRGRIIPELAKPDIGGSPGESKAVKESPFQKYLEQLEKATLATLDLTEVEKLRFAINNGELGKLNAEQERMLTLLAEGLDMQKQAPELRGPSIDDEVLADRNELQKELNSLLDATPSAQTEKQRKLTAELVRMYSDGLIPSAQEFYEALDLAGERTKKLEDETNTFAKQAAASIQSELSGSLTDIFMGDFENLEKNWARLLARLAADAAAANLNKALFGANYGNSGQVGGLLGSLLGSFGRAGTVYGGAGSTDANLIGDYAMPAGPASAGLSQAVRQSVVVNYVYNVEAGVSRGEVTAALRAAEQAQEVKTNQRLRNAGVI